jgi:hypothetical protein
VREDRRASGRHCRRCRGSYLSASQRVTGLLRDHARTLGPMRGRVEMRIDAGPRLARDAQCGTCTVVVAWLEPFPLSDAPTVSV